MTAPEDAEIQQDVQILNLKGIHARSAAKIVKVAEKFKAQVVIRYKDVEVSAESIMGLMLLSARQGAVITLKASGPERVAVLHALSDLVKYKFEEE
jgi:Phosphotransferase System HPr (HPr) Family